MKKVVSFSGGRTSAYLCHLMIERFGRENVDFIFMDTGGEHPKTYEFIRNVNDYFKLNLICLRTDFSSDLGVGNSYYEVSIDDIGPDLIPFKQMMAKYGVPYIGGMFCTDRMKLVPFTKYCKKRYGKGGYETWLGIRADEAARVLGKKLYKSVSELGYDDGEIINIYNMDLDELCNTLVQPEEDDIFYGIVGRRNGEIKYLAEISDFEKQDVLNFWYYMPFDLEIDEQLGNCVFCPKKSNLKLAAAQRYEPGLYSDWLDMIYSDSVRVDDKTGHWAKMYRGKQSLENLIAKFDGSTGEEIKARIRGTKSLDASSCSESCEAFNDG